jgi:hypothetical protein
MNEKVISEAKQLVLPRSAKIFFLGLLLCVASLWAAPAIAVTGDLYTVRNVPVDATAGEAAEARIIAIRQGRRTALRLLLQRLTMQLDWPLLPTLETTEITSIGAGFEVSGERNSPTRYLATITYRFKPVEIRRILRETDIPFSEAQARAMVVLPVFVRGDEVSVWGDDNPWLEAWAARNYAHELVSILMPLGDLGDAIVTPKEALLNPDFAKLAAYGERYNVQDILLVVARQADATAPLKLKVSQINPTSTESYSMSLPVSGDVEASMNYAIDQISKKLQEEWKAKTIIRYGDQRPMVISAKFGTLSDWLAIRHAMNATPNVVESELLGFSNTGAHMNWSVVGSPQQLALALSQYSVELEPGAAKVSRPDSRSNSGPQYGSGIYSGSSLPTYGPSSQSSKESSSNSNFTYMDPEYWVISYQPQTFVDETPFLLEDVKDPGSLDEDYGDPSDLQSQ